MRMKIYFDAYENLKVIKWNFNGVRRELEQR